MRLPPRASVASWLLSVVLPDPDVESMVGDLEEERASRPGAAGAQWYWTQVLRSMPALLWLPIRQGGSLPTFAVAVTACAAQVAIELMVGFGMYRLAPPGARWPTIATSIVILGSLAVLGHQAARRRPGGGTALALVAAFLVSVQLLLAASVGREIPIGTVAALFLGPLMALTGGRFARTSRHG